MALGLALAACGESDAPLVPDTLYADDYKSLSARCEPYGGLKSIKTFRKDSFAANRQFELRCLDYTTINVGSWENVPNKSSEITAPATATVQPSK